MKSKFCIIIALLIMIAAGCGTSREMGANEKEATESIASLAKELTNSGSLVVTEKINEVTFEKAKWRALEIASNKALTAVWSEIDLLINEARVGSKNQAMRDALRSIPLDSLGKKTYFFLYEEPANDEGKNKGCIVLVHFNAKSLYGRLFQEVFQDLTLSQIDSINQSPYIKKKSYEISLVESVQRAKEMENRKMIFLGVGSSNKENIADTRALTDASAKAASFSRAFALAQFNLSVFSETSQIKEYALAAAVRKVFAKPSFDILGLSKTGKMRVYRSKEGGFTVEQFYTISLSDVMESIFSTLKNSLGVAMFEAFRASSLYSLFEANLTTNFPTQD